MKTCFKCNQEFDLSLFNNNKKSKSGKQPYCKPCEKTYYIEYKKNNKEKMRERRLNKYHSNMEIYRQKNRLDANKYRQKNKHTDNFKLKRRFYASERLYYIKQRTPAWLSEKHWKEIKNIYETCPLDHHVDHIIPLRGKEVSGLHVPWNLQHLPAKENLKKHNKLVA